jgi:hypothetical protein
VPARSPPFARFDIGLPLAPTGLRAAAAWCDARRVVEQGRRAALRRKLIVPVVLAVTTIAAVGAVASSTGGCGDNDGPRVDASNSDTPVDTPIV